MQTLCHFSPPLMIKFRSIRQCQWLSLSLDKSKGEFSIVYKKMSALPWLRVYNHDFGLQLVQFHKVCLDIPDALLTICFKHLFCDVSFGKNADLSGMAQAF